MIKIVSNFESFPLRQWRAFLRSRFGGSAAEFAIVALLFVGVIFAVLDFSRALWLMNMAEKATQMGARLAAVSNLVAADLQAWDAVADGGLTAGNRVGIGDFDVTPIICSSTGCAAGGTDWGFDQTSFDAIVLRMNGVLQGISPENVTIEYRHVGMGLAGNPLGPDIEPLITIRLAGIGFDFITPLMSGLDITLPETVSSITGEDNQT